MARARELLANGLLAAAGLGVAIGLAEVVLRAVRPDAGFGAAQELPWMRGDDTARLFTVDPEIGFRPKLDTEVFDAYGAHRNDYPFEKTAGRTRVLFAGDSVTARGRIIEALRARYGDERFEYWNAGVESFNTVQEVAFYEAYNYALEPDRVVLSFHLNDYETTPIAFRNEAGELVVFAPNQPVRQISPWLFEHSRLYRMWLGWVTTGEEFLAVADETERALLRLRDRLGEEGSELTVLVLPLFQKPAKWARQQERAHTRILAFLEREGIRHFDLRPPLEQALAQGLKVQEHPGDTWHPNDEVAEVIASYLYERRVLSLPDDPSPGN